jgi:hypothetical protein
MKYGVFYSMDALQIGYFKLPDSPLKEKRVELK